MSQEIITLDGVKIDKHSVRIEPFLKLFAVFARSGPVKKLPLDCFATRAEAQIFCDQVGCIPAGHRAKVQGKYVIDLDAKKKRGQAQLRSQQ